MKAQITNVKVVNDKYEVSYNTGTTRWYPVDNAPKTVTAYLASQETAETEENTDTAAVATESAQDTAEDTAQVPEIEESTETVVQAIREEKRGETPKMNERTLAQVFTDTKAAVKDIGHAIATIASVPVWGVWQVVKAVHTIACMILLAWYTVSDWFSNATAAVVYRVAKTYKIVHGYWLVGCDYFFRGYEIAAQVYGIVTDWFEKSWSFREELIRG